jgi:hypothetical protein
MARKPTGSRSRREKLDEHLSIRVDQQTRAALEFSAKKRGRELTEDLRERLKDSVAHEQIAERLYGSPRNYAMARLINMLISNIEYEAGTSWFESRWVFEAVTGGLEELRSAPTVIADAPSPDDGLIPPPRARQILANDPALSLPRELGKRHARGILAQLRGIPEILVQRAGMHFGQNLIELVAIKRDLLSSEKVIP